ncbi:MAG: metallophosphoesterase, partial [Myxococcaceae bacterium]|nr:metallophosphoesterase [Myxococcaceae bacterium]
MARLDTAIDVAQRDAQNFRSAPPDGAPRAVHVAIGDAQAPLATFLGVLDRDGLIGDDGRLKPDVHLVSIGDHFDYGPPEWRSRATAEATALLAWLAAHPADQVTLILGNHDQARVAELGAFDDVT